MMNRLRSILLYEFLSIVSLLLAVQHALENLKVLK